MDRVVAVLGLSLVVTGCGDPFFTGTIEGREVFDPPAVYAEWWDSTEACSSTSGNIGRVEWFLATSIVADGFPAKARWSPPHEIIIVRGYEAQERVVRHEMLHDLLAGDAAHENAAWEACELTFD